jgi:RHS repeat-associated protein
MSLSILTAGSADNSDVVGIFNNRFPNRSQSFTYDSLNRILAATTTATNSTDLADCWGEAYVYDNQSNGGGAWGNLTNINGASPSSYNGCTQETLSVSASAKNQISSNGYDLSGNVTSSGTASYTYNAESQLTGAAGITYEYDGDGRRISKSNGKIYWYGGGSDPINETDASGNTTDEYIFFGGIRIARRDPSGNIVYYIADHLGTSRLVTDASGAILDQSDFYPFGGERVISASSGNTYKFTAKERDTESGLDYFGARHYASSMGRWMSPDAPFADQHPASPQSWDMYLYTRNNPLSAVDADGRKVEVLTALALQRVQSTVPADVRSQVIADKNGLLNRAAIDGIKSTNSNVMLLKQAVDLDKTIEVTTGTSVQGGQPSGPDGVVGVPFEYQSVTAQQAVVTAAGFDASSITTPSVYDGYTQTAEQSPSGNIRVTVADGTGATSTEPAADLASTTAHELYGHALPNAQGKPYEHDNGGPVDQNIEKIENATRHLDKTEQ